MLCACALASCREQRGGEGQASAFGGAVDDQRGARLLRERGCGRCHHVPGVRGADGWVGPPLDAFSRRSFVAGRLPNSPENLARWIRDPRSVDPQTAMPQVPLSAQQARDIAAYLFSLR